MFLLVLGITTLPNPSGPVGRVTAEHDVPAVAAPAAIPSGPGAGLLPSLPAQASLQPAAATPSQVEVPAPALPALVLAAQAPARQAAAPERPARFGRVFDGSGSRLSDGGGGAGVPPDGRGGGGSRRERLWRRLQAIAAPWATRKQLDRLEASPRAPDERLRFAVIGDCEPGRFWISRKLFNFRGVFWKQLADADRRGADFIIQLGDMVSRGTPRRFLSFFQNLARTALTRPYLTVIGNHDRRRPHGVTDSKTYRRIFGETDYSFDRGGVRFVVLDSSAGRVTPRQLAWLDSALDVPGRKIVFTHKPPAAAADESALGAVFALGGFKKGSEEFTEIVARRAVERVYMGHIHALATLVHKGVRYVLTGGGGSPLFPVGLPNVFHHYLTVDVGPDGLRETVHRLGEPPSDIP